MMEALSFEQLPKAVAMLTKEVGEIKELLLKNREHHPSDLPEQLLTVQEAAKFLCLSVPTIYSKVSKGELPVMKRGKRLYFSRIELLDYLRQGRRKTNAEIDAAAEDHLKKKGGRYD